MDGMYRGGTSATDSVWEVRKLAVCVCAQNTTAVDSQPSPEEKLSAKISPERRMLLYVCISSLQATLHRVARSFTLYRLSGAPTGALEILHTL